jgi:hypothetical protein
MDPRQVTPNDFQRRVEQRLNAALKDLGLQVDSRRVGWEEPEFDPRQGESVVHVRAGEIEVRIRENSASFTVSGKGDYYEMPDYTNPEALADALLASVTERWHGRQRK